MYINRDDGRVKSLEKSIKDCLLIIQERYLGLGITQIPDVNYRRDKDIIIELVRKKMGAKLKDAESRKELSIVA